MSIDNHAQLALVTRAEKLVGPRDVYFDGVGMLPNRIEPSTLWLDRHSVLTTLREGERSEAYRIFAEDPPKVILWSYRMDAISRLVAPLIRDSYVRGAPNLWIAGHSLRPGQTVTFNVPLAGRYALYDGRGRPVQGGVEVDGTLRHAPFDLSRGPRTVKLLTPSDHLLILPEGSYSGRLIAGPDDRTLFDDVYN